MTRQNRGSTVETYWARPKRRLPRSMRRLPRWPWLHRWPRTPPCLQSWPGGLDDRLGGRGRDAQPDVPRSELQHIWIIPTQLGCASTTSTSSSCATMPSVGSACRARRRQCQRRGRAGGGEPRNNAHGRALWFAHNVRSPRRWPTGGAARIVRPPSPPTGLLPSPELAQRHAASDLGRGRGDVRYFEVQGTKQARGRCRRPSASSRAPNLGHERAPPSGTRGSAP